MKYNLTLASAPIASKITLEQLLRIIQLVFCVGQNLYARASLKLSRHFQRDPVKCNFEILTGHCHKLF